MEEEKVISFSADQREVVDRRSKDIFFAIKQLNDWVQDGTLTEEMRDTLPNLAKSHLDAIGKMIGYTGEETDRLKDMTKQMNQYLHDRIKELESMVNKQNSILTVKQQLKSIEDALRRWWDDKGFHYISDISFTGNGCLEVKFGFMLDNLSLGFSSTPHSDKEALKNKKQNLKDQGYVFARSKHEKEKDLIDCDSNRKLLIELVHSVFPTAKITSFRNHLYMEKGEDENNFIIRDFEVYIYDFEEIERLVDSLREEGDSGEGKQTT